ncbi:MAG: hypothetical protein WC813_02615 [Patescibacteria group bacterium]|jgi:hypothetical protein
MSRGKPKDKTEKQNPQKKPVNRYLIIKPALEADAKLATRSMQVIRHRHCKVR